MPVSDLSDTDIDAVYSAISKAHGIKILKGERRAKLEEQERSGALSVDIAFGEIFITARGGRIMRLKKS